MYELEVRVMGEVTSSKRTDSFEEALEFYRINNILYENCIVVSIDGVMQKLIDTWRMFDIHWRN